VEHHCRPLVQISCRSPQTLRADLTTQLIYYGLFPIPATESSVASAHCCPIKSCSGRGAHFLLLLRQLRERGQVDLARSGRCQCLDLSWTCLVVISCCQWPQGYTILARNKLFYFLAANAPGCTVLARRSKLLHSPCMYVCLCLWCLIHVDQFVDLLHGSHSVTLLVT
jgi:hypothetical protein